MTTKPTLTIVSELLSILRNDEGGQEQERKLTSLIERLEKLESAANQTVFSEDDIVRVEKHKSVNHHIHIESVRYKRQPLHVITEGGKCATIYAFVEQSVCCLSGNEADYRKCCAIQELRCDTCPHKATVALEDALITSSDKPVLSNGCTNDDATPNDDANTTPNPSARINLTRSNPSKPCEGCDCGRKE